MISEEIIQCLTDQLLNLNIKLIQFYREDMSCQLKKALINLVKPKTHLRHSTSSNNLKSKMIIRQIKSANQSKSPSKSKSKSKSKQKSKSKHHQKHKHISRQPTPSLKKIDLKTTAKKKNNNKSIQITIPKKKHSKQESKISQANKSKPKGKQSIKIATKTTQPNSNAKSKKQKSGQIFTKKKSKLKPFIKLNKQLFKTEQSQLFRVRSISKLNDPIPMKDQSIIYTAISTPSSKSDNVFKNQQQITPKIRAILVDWMIAISSEILLSRETLHLAVYYLDAYAMKREILKKQFQLCGIACLILALKQQQSDNKKNVNELLFSCGEKGQWTEQDFFRMQKNIVVTLQFKLKTFSLAFWVDYLTERWDKHIDKISENFGAFRFRQSCKTSFAIWRQLNTLVECALYDGLSVSLNKTKIVLAVMYLVLRVNLESYLASSDKNKQFQQMYLLFQKKATPIFNDPYRINPVFNEFMVQTSGCEMDQIISEVKYMSQYLNIKFSYCIPQNLAQLSDIKYQQFLSFQVHYPEILVQALSKFKN